MITTVRHSYPYNIPDHYIQLSLLVCSLPTKPLSMQASIFGSCPKPGQIGRVAAGRASSVKIGDEGGGLLISLDGVPPTQIVGVSASDIPLHHEVQKKISSGTGSFG